jgi:hypothetical protein
LAVAQARGEPASNPTIAASNMLAEIRKSFRIIQISPEQ